MVIIWISYSLFVLWLLGVGLLATAMPLALREASKKHPILGTAIEMMPEAVCLFFAVMIASWPVSFTTMAIIDKFDKRGGGRGGRGRRRRKLSAVRT